MQYHFDREARLGGLEYIIIDDSYINGELQDIGISSVGVWEGGFLRGYIT